MNSSLKANDNSSGFSSLSKDWMPEMTDMAAERTINLKHVNVI